MQKRFITEYKLEYSIITEYKLEYSIVAEALYKGYLRRGDSSHPSTGDKK
jgi:hypothetical protein